MDPIASFEFDPEDCRPRQPGEPGDHLFSRVINPGVPGLNAVEFRFYEEGRFDVIDLVTKEKLPIDEFYRDEDGNEVFEGSFER